MANRIKIRRGSGKPSSTLGDSNYLLPYELGWDTTNKVLYINDSGAIKSAASTVSDLLTIGLRETSTSPSSETSINRVAITPYFHTGGPWYIKSMDDSSNAYLALYYGSSQLLKIKHNGVFSTTIQANITGNAGGANALNFVHTNELILGNNTSQSQIWLNYRRVQNGAASGNTAITEYRFCNGNGGTTGVTLYADSFTGAAAYLTTPNTAGFKTDQYGNFQHQSTTTTDYWTIKSNAGTDKFKVHFENGDTNINGTIYITPSLGNYREGIRIKPYDSWATIVLGGNDLSADSGTSANTWSIHNSNGSFYITRNGSSTGTAQLACVSNKWSISGNITSPSTASSWLAGQNSANGAYNVGDATNTGSYWPWMRQTNTSSAKWFSFGTLNTSFYWIGSATSRTENSYDFGMNFDVATGKLSVGGAAVIRDSGTTARRIFVTTSTSVPSGAVNGDIVLVKA